MSDLSSFVTLNVRICPPPISGRYCACASRDVNTDATSATCDVTRSIYVFEMNYRRRTRLSVRAARFRRFPYTRSITQQCIHVPRVCTHDRERRAAYMCARARTHIRAPYIASRRRRLSKRAFLSKRFFFHRIFRLLDRSVSFATRL